MKFVLQTSPDHTQTYEGSARPFTDRAGGLACCCWFLSGKHADRSVALQSKNLMTDRSTWDQCFTATKCPSLSAKERSRYKNSNRSRSHLAQADPAALFPCARQLCQAGRSLNRRRRLLGSSGERAACSSAGAAGHAAV